MSSSHLNFRHHPPPYDDVDDPLISDSEKSARLPTSFDSREQFWSNMISLSWRCLTTAFALLLLVIGLWVFSRMGKLSRIEQREFNAITILLGAFASLGLGSMLGYLGSMLRWRLLARKKYKMRDVELLLAMPSPTGSAKLLITHFREQRLSLTTFIVMIYLLANISGRFSVAVFGLTFNLKDNSTNIYPTLTTDWAHNGLVGKGILDFEVEKNFLSYLDLARGGLTAFGSPPDIKFDTTVPQSLTDKTLNSLELSVSKLEETRGNVSFAYRILDFEGGQRVQKPSDHTVHSSARCTMLRLDGYRYWKDYGGNDQTNEDWKDESNREAIAEVLRELDNTGAGPGQGTERVTWAAPLPVVEKLGPFSMTYVVYNHTAWECASSLFETRLGNPHPKPLFNSASLFLLPIAQREGQGAPGAGGHLGNSRGGSSAGGDSIVHRPFTELESLSSPSVGVQTLDFYRDGKGGSATQQRYYNLYVAALIARLPIAAIAYGNSDKRFPLVYKDPKVNAHSTEHVETTLEVKWNKVGFAAGTILICQIMAITVVVCYCRTVYVREDSYLTTAELLKTVLNKIGDGSMMTGKELEDALDDVLKAPVSYGTISGTRGDQPRVALGRKVDYKFPEFPPFQKRSVSRQ